LAWPMSAREGDTPTVDREKGRGVVDAGSASAADGMIYLVECRECRRHTRIDLTEMARRCGDVDVLEQFRPHLKCMRCGSVEFVVEPFGRTKLRRSAEN